MSEALARLRLARSEGVGPTYYRRLLERFGSARAAIAALSRHPERFRAASEADCAREMAATAEIYNRAVLAELAPLRAVLPAGAGELAPERFAAMTCCVALW